MNWKNVTVKKYVTENNKSVLKDVINFNKQIDEVGNIVQHTGGVQTKACQKCRREFESKIIKVEIKQRVSYYDCTECNFSSANSNGGLDHMIETTHKLTKTSKNKVMGYDNIIQGVISHITKTDDDMIILCGDCDLFKKLREDGK